MFSTTGNITTGTGGAVRWSWRYPTLGVALRGARCHGRHWVNLLRHTSLRAGRQPSTYTHVRLGLPARSRLVWLATCPSACAQIDPLPGSEHREGIRRGARAADDVERRDHQHEIVSLLLDTRLGQRLQEGIVQQRGAVGKEAGVDGPRNVVADGLMIEHVPDEHAHVVVPQEGQARDVEPGPGQGRAEGPAIGRLGIGALPRLASRVDADGVARLEGDAAR